jgi:hypothetical protein
MRANEAHRAFFKNLLEKYGMMQFDDVALNRKTNRETLKGTPRG